MKDSVTFWPAEKGGPLLCALFKTIKSSLETSATQQRPWIKLNRTLSLKDTGKMKFHINSYQLLKRGHWSHDVAYDRTLLPNGRINQYNVVVSQWLLGSNHRATRLMHMAAWNPLPPKMKGRSRTGLSVHIQALEGFWCCSEEALYCRVAQSLASCASSLRGIFKDKSSPLCKSGAALDGPLGFQCEQREVF